MAILHYAEQRPANTVLPHNVGLWRIAVSHMRHIAHVDGGAVHGLNRQIIEFSHGLRTGIQLYLMLQRPELRGTGRQNKILCADGIHHVHRTQVRGLESRRI